MQPSAVLSCQVSSWYPLFGHLGFKSKVLDLSQDVVDYLVRDGVFFPEGSSAVRLSGGHSIRLDSRCFEGVVMPF